MKESYSALIGAASILLIWFIVNQLEIIYKEKGWYGPSFTPPSGYIAGPLSRDQGNNIWWLKYTIEMRLFSYICIIMIDFVLTKWLFKKEWLEIEF